MARDHVHDEDELEEEAIEIYCVRCREMVIAEDVTPVWTRKGLPATRGICPQCGSTVFRLGKTDLHDEARRPNAIRVATNTGAELAQKAVYINFAPEDAQIAGQIAHELQRIGLACWMHELEPDDVDWAGGVHPALKECAQMVLVLSPATSHEPSIEQAWTYFRSKNKPVAIAQVAPADPPDALRRRPRYDFSDDFKTAFRQLVQILSE